MSFCNAVGKIIELFSQTILNFTASFVVSYRHDEIVAVAGVELPPEPQHCGVLVLVAEDELVILGLVSDETPPVVSVGVLRNIDGVIMSTFPTFSSSGSFTHHNGGFSVIDPPDDDVCAPQVAPEGERQAHPARRHNLKLKWNRERKRPLSKHVSYIWQESNHI